MKMLKWIQHDKAHHSPLTATDSRLLSHSLNFRNSAGKTASNSLKFHDTFTLIFTTSFRRPFFIVSWNLTSWIYYCHSDREVLFTSTRDLPHSVQSYSRDAESLSFRARRYRDTKSFKWCNFLLKLCIKLLSFLFWIAQKRNKKD